MPQEASRETSQETWTAVDNYVTEMLIPADPALDAALAAVTAAGLPPIAVSPAQGRLLYVFAHLVGARRILELGTLGGYSTICMARALPPDGKLITLEADEKHAKVARGNFAAAGLDRVIELRLGKALDTLPKLAAEGQGPFDLIFIDADKENMPGYLTWSLKLSRPGTAIVVDNVVHNGELADPSSTDPGVLGRRRMHELLHKEPRITSITVQTVGCKGYDGFTLCCVKG